MLFVCFFTFFMKVFFWKVDYWWNQLWHKNRLRIGERNLCNPQEANKKCKKNHPIDCNAQSQKWWNSLPIRTEISVKQKNCLFSLPRVVKTLQQRAEGSGGDALQEMDGSRRPDDVMPYEGLLVHNPDHKTGLCHSCGVFSSDVRYAACALHSGLRVSYILRATAVEKKQSSHFPGVRLMRPWNISATAH